MLESHQHIVFNSLAIYTYSMIEIPIGSFSCFRRCYFTDSILKVLVSPSTIEKCSDSAYSNIPLLRCAESDCLNCIFLDYKLHKSIYKREHIDSNKIGKSHQISEYHLAHHCSIPSDPINSKKLWQHEKPSRVFASSRGEFPRVNFQKV